MIENVIDLYYSYMVSHFRFMFFLFLFFAAAHVISQHLVGPAFLCPVVSDVIIYVHLNELVPHGLSAKAVLLTITICLTFS